LEKNNSVMIEPDLDTKIEEIKELVTTPDYDTIDKGVALARELNEPAVFEKLLEGSSINIENDYNYPLIPGELFQGGDNNQHFLNYALLNLIGYTPEDAGIDSSIKIESLTLLQLTTKLEIFPIGICSLVHLIKLNLSDCSLKNLPPEIGNLKKLENLNLAGNNIVILPDEIGALTCLKKLFLDGNQLKTLPESIQKLTALEDDGGLWIWDMDDLKVPKSVQDFVHNKIMGDYIFQLELIRWGYKYNIIDHEPAPEDLQENSTNKPISDWCKLLVNIAQHPDCPIEFLTKFIEPFKPSDNDEYLELSFSDLVVDTAYQNPNLMNWLKPAGFGRYADPDTGAVIAKMQDGKLVAFTSNPFDK